MATNAKVGYLRAGLLTLVLAPHTRALAETVTVRNDVPRRDTSGNILEAADGNIVWHGGKHYLFGVRYQPCHEPDTTCGVTGGNLGPPEWPPSDRDCSDNGERAPGTCCGWRNMTFAAYSSPDLSTWTLESSNILPAMTDPASPYRSSYSMMSVPAAAYNAATGKFVLWFQHVLRYNKTATKGIATGVKAVARADHPAGPFEVVHWNASKGLANPNGFTGSTGQKIWATPQGEAFLAHNGAPELLVGWPKGQYISRLSADYLTIVETSAPIGVQQGFTEGGGLFQHGGRWYLMAGHGCCFCPRGSNGYVYTATDPMGPYVYQGDVIPHTTVNGSNVSVTKAQQFSVSALHTAGGGVQPLFTGVRFGSSPDLNKRHDYQYWYPLQFDAHGRVLPLTWLPEFTVEIEID